MTEEAAAHTDSKEQVTSGQVTSGVCYTRLTMLYSFPEFVRLANQRLAEYARQEGLDDPDSLEVSERMARYYARRKAIADGRRLSELSSDERRQIENRRSRSSSDTLRGNIRFYDEEAVDDLVNLKLRLRTATLDELGFPPLAEEISSLRSIAPAKVVPFDDEALITSSFVDHRIQDAWQVRLSPSLTLVGSGRRPSSVAVRNLAQFVADNFPSEEEVEPATGGLRIDIELADICAPFNGALVNASNAEIRPGGGVAGRVWDVCGHDELAQARQLLVGLDADPSMRRAILRPGEAVWTTAGRGVERGFSGIIHAHGPRWRSRQERDSVGRITPDHGEDAQLRQTWRSVLRVADENGARRLAAPMISTGIYGFPAPEGFEIAFDTMIGTKSLVENVVVRTNSRRVFDQLVVSRHKVLSRHNLAG